MKTYLITGGAGFMGANLKRKILQQNPSATIHIIEPKNTNLWRLADIQNNITLHHLSLIDFKDIQALVTTIKPTTIFHLASYGGMPSQQKQIPTFDVNLYGTINLLNACKKVGFDCFINTGSSSEYGKKDSPMKESDILEPNSDYGIAKAAATHYCVKEAMLHNLPIYTIRPFSVYGDYEASTRLIPTVALSFLANKQLNLSNPNNVRDFVYIDDIINAYIILAEKKPSEPYVFNIGSGKQSSIQDVINALQQITQKTVPTHWQSIEPRPWEPTQWQANIEQARNVLGWAPLHTLEQGLQKTLQWFEHNQNLYLAKETKNECLPSSTTANFS